MTNRNDWRTRQKYPDDSFDDNKTKSSSKTTHDWKNTYNDNRSGYGRRYSYDVRYSYDKRYSYDERDSYDRRDSYDKRYSCDGRDSYDRRGTIDRDDDFFKPRPASSTTRREYDDGGISDTSTHSEPPFNKPKFRRNNKPVSNNKGDASKGAEPNTKDKAKQNQQNYNNKSKDPKAYPPTSIDKGDSKTYSPTKSTSKAISSVTPLAGKGTGVQSKSLDKKSNNPQALSVPQKKGTGNTQSVPKQTSNKVPAKTSASVEVGTKQQSPKKDLNQKSLSTNPALKKESSNIATSDNTPPSPNTPTGTTKQKTQSSTTAQKATTVEKKSVKNDSNPEQKTITPQTDNTLPQNPAKTGQSNTSSGQDTNLQGKTNISPKKEPPNPATQNVTPSLTAPTSPLILPVIKQPASIASGNNSSNTNPDDITKVTTQKESPKIEDKIPQTQAVPPQILPSAPEYPPPPIPLPNTGQVNQTNEPITNPTVLKEQANPTNEASTPKATNPPTQLCSSDKNPQAVPPQILPSAPEYPPPPIPLPNTPSTPLTQPTPTSPVNSDTNSSLQPMNPFPNLQSVAANTVEEFSSGNLATLDNNLSTQSLVPHHTSEPGNLIPVDNKTKESNVINTLPSHQDIFPPQRDITGSTFKELVSTDTQLFGEDMSDQPTTELMEKVKELSTDLGETKQKVIKAEEKEENSKEEILRLNEERDHISKELEQKKKDIDLMAEAKIEVLGELQSHIQQVAKLGVENSKVNKEMDAIKKECDALKTQVEHNTATRAEIDKLNKEKQQLNSNSQKLSKEIADKDKTNTKLKASHSAEIKVLNSKMDESTEAFAESQSEIKKITDDRDDRLGRIDIELQTAKEGREMLETEKKNSIQEIKRLKEKIGGLEKDTVGLRDYISQFEKEIKQNETSTGPNVDKELISKIEKAFVDLSGLIPPPEYEPGSQERVEWLVASLVSWNADLNGKISINESYLHEKQTEIETMQVELQTIMNYLQHQMPTNPSSTAINSTNPLNLFKSILAGKTEELSKAKDLIRKAETDKQKMEMQIQEISRHYNTEDSKNEQLMQDNAALERQIQTLISEKEELEVKNVELINELSELQEGTENLDSPTTQSKRTNPGHVEGSFNPRPSHLYLETTSPFPFDTPMSPPHTALSSLTLGHRSTLQKAADELSHLKVKVWESEAENSKLREQLSAQVRDHSLPTNVSPDAEGAFHAVFEANQVNLVKLAESTRDKEALFKDIEFLRQRVEDLEKNAERLKVSIEVKEVAYKELYLECRDWERKCKKCSNVHHELERVKRQLLRKEAESQECATLRAERLNQQTTLDNLGAELQERKNIDQNLRRNNQKLQTRLDECLGHISNMQTHIQDKFIVKPLKHSLPEAPPHTTPFPSQQQEPHPVSPTILKPPSMSSAPLSPPTRQPPTVAPISKHPPILYPPTS